MTRIVVQPDPNRIYITYIHDTSIEPIHSGSHNDTNNSHNNHAKSAKEINDTELNLYLGYPWLQRSSNNRWVRNLIEFVLIKLVLYEYWEQYLYRFYNHYIPISIKRTVIYQLWYIFFSIYTYLFQKYPHPMGLHPHASMEYHAITTLMYLFRFFPNTVVRMRFALHQLTSCQPKSYISSSSSRGHRTGSFEIIDTPYIPSLTLSTTSSASGSGSTATTTSSSSSESENATTTATTNTNKEMKITPPDVQKNFCRVKGLYVHYNSHSTNNTNDYYHEPPTEYTLFWLYGGAFLSGDTYGNLGPADTIAYHSNQMDVFLVEYRLAPEYCMDDILWDVCLAYRYLYDLRQQRNQDPNKILLFGCSSGAALCLRLMQYISELRQGQEHIIQPPYIQSILHSTMMPSGAVLASPYIDYTADLDPDGSFLQYSCHDLIVTEAVQEVGLPYLNTHMGRTGNRTTHSPLAHTMKYLPPICVVVSQHETVYDETIRFIDLARMAGVPVTVGIWKYMCHVFLFFNGFIPEGQQAMDFISQWYKTIATPVATTTKQ